MEPQSSLANSTKYSELPVYVTGKDIISYTCNIAHQSYSLFKTTVKRDHSSKSLNKAGVLWSFQNETLVFFWHASNNIGLL